jgi:hypothetical protein
MPPRNYQREIKKAFVPVLRVSRKRGSRVFQFNLRSAKRSVKVNLSGLSTLSPNKLYRLRSDVGHEVASGVVRNGDSEVCEERDPDPGRTVITIRRPTSSKGEAIRSGSHRLVRHRPSHHMSITLSATPGATYLSVVRASGCFIPSVTAVLYSPRHFDRHAFEVHFTRISYPLSAFNCG